MAADLDVYVESLGNFGSAREYSIQSLLPYVEDAKLKVRVLDRLASGSRAPAALMHAEASAPR